jgi:hypothetical protein
VSGGEAGIASALAASSSRSDRAPRPLPPNVARRLRVAQLEPRRVAAYYEQLANRAPRGTIAAHVEEPAAGVEEQLLHLLAAGLESAIK